MSPDKFLETVRGKLADGRSLVLVMRGIPGSGKSTLANRMLLEVPGHVQMFSADLFSGLYVNGKLNPDKLPDAHKACMGKFAMTLGSRMVGSLPGLYIVDNTNLALWECAKYIELAQAWEFPAFIVNVTPPSRSVALARNVHNVPPTVFERMCQTWDTERLMPWWPVMEVDSM